MGVMSGLEMACWDIIGKAVDKPVHALIGGKLHETLRSYTYLYPDEDMDEDVSTVIPMPQPKWPPAMLMKVYRVEIRSGGGYTTLDPICLSLKPSTDQKNSSRLSEGCRHQSRSALRYPWPVLAFRGKTSGAGDGAL